MAELSVHLDTRFFSEERKDCYKFHPYVKSNFGGKRKKEIWDINGKPEEKPDILFILFVLVLVLSIQAVLAVGSYSGEGRPPLFGDFEAQRHWMEITYNLPIREWYINTTSNDLLYWGLDYPPLTAYHSYFMGAVANYMNSSWVALTSSRGLQSVHHKLFMRMTAILPFHFFYAPSLTYFVFSMAKDKDTSLNLIFVLVLSYPGLLAIDNAHLQYNSISLGLFLLSFIFLVRWKVLFGSVFFVLALNYKQMELYHALPIFTFLLSRCFKKPLQQHVVESMLLLLKVSIVVLSTFALLWIPFLFYGRQTVLAVLQRIFPFYRGLYEDKVASVWCALNSVIRMKDHFSLNTQIKISAACVILATFPSLLLLFLRPTVKNFKSSLLISSLAFFLFSFQVHEKSILLAAVPALLLLPEHRIATLWLLHISNTSIFSLCLKDGNCFLLALFVAYYIACSSTVKFPTERLLLLYHLSCITAIGICIVEWTATPPERYPHIFPLLNAVYSCVHFFAFLVYFYLEMICYEYRLFVGKST